MDNLVDVYIQSVKEGNKFGFPRGATFSATKQRYQHLEPSYKLWREYLQKSTDYIGVCEWFESSGYGDYLLDLVVKSVLSNITHTHTEAFLMNYLLYIGNKEDFTLGRFLRDELGDGEQGKLRPHAEAVEALALMTGKTVENHSFFNWAIRKGFPFSNEMLINFFVFGGVEDDSRHFSEVWPRVVFMLEARRKRQSRSVETMESHLDDLFEEAESITRGDTGKSPNLHKFKEALRLVLTKDPDRLYLSIKNPTQMEGPLLKQINSLIKERDFEEKRMNGSGRTNLEEYQFECPTTIGRIPELQRYLEVYDLRERKGRTNREIYLEMYPPELRQHADPKRLIARDYRKAKKIIENVEQGYFPGDYQ